MDTDPDPFVWDEWSGESSPMASTDGSPSSSWDELNDVFSVSPGSSSPTALFHHGADSGGGTSTVFSDGSFHVVDLPQDACSSTHTDVTWGFFCSNIDTNLDPTRLDPSHYIGDMSLEYLHSSLSAQEGYVNNEPNPSGPVPSITDDEGNTKPGHLWCCNKWREEGAMLNRHMKTKNHNPRVLCEADPQCTNREAQRRDMYRHYWRAHKTWARENNIPPQEKQCKDCEKWYARKDFWKRHRVKGTCPALRKRQRGRSSSPQSSSSFPVRLLPKPMSSSPESSP